MRGSSRVTLDELGIAPDPDEDSVEAFETFEENAMAKARYYFARARSLRRARARRWCSPMTPGWRCARSAARRACGASDSPARALDGHALDDANNAKLMDALRGVAGSARAVRVRGGGQDGERRVAARGACGGAIARGAARRRTGSGTIRISTVRN